MRQNLAVYAISTIALLLFFYACSVSLTFYNKWMAKRFRFPLITTLVHFLVIFSMTSILRILSEACCKRKWLVLQWTVYFKRVFPAAVAGSLDIGLSNWSIMLSTVSLYTMSKSSSIVFIMLFSLFFKLEKPSLVLFLVGVTISLGLFLFTYESEQFNLFGFLIALVASAFSGLRWTLIQIIMQKDEIGLHNPMDTIYHILPVMALSILPLAFIVEGPHMASSVQFVRADHWSVALASLALMLVGAFLAFLLTVSEYMFLASTSSLALAIAGIFKEIFVLTIATEFGGDKLNWVNFFGLVLCLSGIALHVGNKALKESGRTLPKVGESTPTTEAIPMLQLSDGESEDDVVWEAVRR